VAGVTELLTLVVLAVVAAGLGVVIVDLRRLVTKTDVLGQQLHERPADDQQIESLARQTSAAEKAAVNAEETSRLVSRQLSELSKVTVDQAVVLVEVRDDLVKKLPRPDGRQAVRHAQSTGETA
jgi:hypothetical protein